MRRISIILGTILLGVSITACQDGKTANDTLDREYILFPDTLSYHGVLENREYFTVPVISTVACDYDRTIAVTIDDEGSNAIEGKDYYLESNTLVIPAGAYKTEVKVYPQYKEFENDDTLSFNLRLVMPDQLKLDLSGDKTKVTMYKICPFNLDAFDGWCVVTSMFLYSYPGLTNADGSYQRLIQTEKAQDEENTIIMHDWLFDGYDVRIKFDTSDPENPIITMPEDQVISDELFVFGQTNGDNRILGMTSPAYVSYYSTCESFVALWMRAYVYDLSDLIGYVGDFYNIMEWVSDEEADRLQKEEGM